VGRLKTGSLPSYRRHASGQARVTLKMADGTFRDVLLGMYGSEESRAEYGRVITEWLESGGASIETSNDLTINEMLARYWLHAERYYVKDGKPTSEQDTIRQALRFLRRLYGHTIAKDFGPLALKTVRREMVEHSITRQVKVKNLETGEVRTETKVLQHGLARSFINKQMDRIKRAFKWAVENELLPVTVYQALLTVPGLEKGRGQAREKEKVGPVREEIVQRTLPHLSDVVRAMVQVQRLAGMRPQEVVGMKATDLDMTGPVWEYRPYRHKTEHLDKERIIFLGPRAQALLRPFLSLELARPLFSPRQAVEQRNARRRAERKSKMTPSQKARKPKAKPKVAPGTQYTVASYRKAIRRACERAGVPLWFPNQLRHSAGTEIRKRYGLEASQAVLGHSELETSQIYAEVDRATARKVMADIG